MLRDLSKVDNWSITVQTPVCVIGAGLAGLVAASRIARAGCRVIVLESGRSRQDNTLDGLNEIEDAGLYRHAVTGRARALGGTSTAWGGRMMPLTEHDLGARDYLGLDAWPIAKSDLDRQLGHIEQLFDLDQTSYEAEFPAPFAVEALGPTSDHMQSRWAKWPTFRRRNIARNLRAEIDGGKNLTVWLDATVCGFSIDRDRGTVLGVEARSTSGAVMTVTARDFILACGTFESTRLLLLLDRLSGHRAFEGSPALGRHFNDHLALEIGRLRRPTDYVTNRIFGYHIGGRTRRSLHLETTALAQREDRAGSGFVTVRPEYRAGSLHHYVRNIGKSEQGDRTKPSPRRFAQSAITLPPALFWRLAYKQMYFGQQIDLFVDARVEQVGQHHSRLSLSDKLDRFGIPRLKMEWRKTSADEHTLRSVVRRSRQFWRSTVLEQACPVEWTFDPDDEGVSFCEASRDTRHPAGSARMGLNKASSVVNCQLRCHSVPNVLVASAATFPSSGSANPTLTIMQLASIAAESVLA